MHAEINRQDDVDEVDMQLIASVIDKCFKIQERGIPMGAGNEALLANFVTKVEN